jgi:hypothetical protein
VNADNALASSWVANSNESLSVHGFNTSAIDFAVYPNPAKEKVRVNSEQTIQEILLFNPLGQQIKKMTVNLKSIEISIRELHRGIYYLDAKLINGDRISTKIMKE